MESGHVVEFIDQQKILCAVVLEVKKKRLRLLTESNREVKLSAGRLSHQGEVRLDLAMGRDKMVHTLKAIAGRRNALLGNIDIQELWEVLNSEQEWIDLATMTEFCFPKDRTVDHESAVVRALFQDKLYFKFNPDRFFPNSEAKVEEIAARHREAERRERVIDAGAAWLKRFKLQETGTASETLDVNSLEYINILKSYYLFEKESPHWMLAKAILDKAGVSRSDSIFSLLVKAGVFTEDENVELLQHEIPVAFDAYVTQSADHLSGSFADFSSDPLRKDLTHLSAMTIDGQSTLDFDDALSIESLGSYFQLGVHISDVGHFIERGSAIDQAGVERGSSIYTPDQRIPMLPSSLAEGLCSLKAGESRPAISVMIRIDPRAEVVDWEIFPSVIRVKDQLSYYDVNLMADDNQDIGILCNIAENFRRKRLASGAVQINLPDIHIWLGNDGEITVNRVNRESPGRRLVAEIMIMANWLMAKFLATHKMPAIYRTQPEPRARLYSGEEGTLFQNYMQRRMLNRFRLSTQPESHSGLGLDAYVTATSPIRKYFDLVTQRQIRAAFGLEKAYLPEEISRIIQVLEHPMSRVSLIQRNRSRYWLLKYLETQIGKKEEAIVLAKRRQHYQILLKNYMLECDLPLSGGLELKPEDLIQVTLQQANARKDIISVFMG